jgi:hypothetical protein
LQALSTPNRASIQPDNDSSWEGYSQESFDDADFPSPSPSVFSPHIITAAERYKTQLLSKSGKYLAYTVFGGANRGVYYNWCVVISLKTSLLILLPGVQLTEL